ncbi:hypothetical protein RHGRI_032015 [Rhododendron griersonianum]|uniref:Uncharacterized protein n=1 Tax=Rhododendron griersonianum TaxID=479676 RepID=A0AAV6IAD2_9ERIC|nr:hypothetical protein RHGRI_032015 [Rhododendron griersonianum]
MNIYGLELGLHDFGISDPSIIGSLSRSFPFLSTTTDFKTTKVDDNRPPPPVVPKKKKASPPRHRHDGTSPLPFGMDWSLVRTRNFKNHYKIYSILLFKEKDGIC